MKNGFFKRLISGLLAVVLILSDVPALGFASETDGCTHHVSHENCSYRAADPGAACTHVCAEDCLKTVTECVHRHGDCGYREAVPATPCDHVHGDCGYVKAEEGIPCDHAHGEDCGYRKAV